MKKMFCSLMLMLFVVVFALLANMPAWGYDGLKFPVVIVGALDQSMAAMPVATNPSDFFNFNLCVGNIGIAGATLVRSQCQYRAIQERARSGTLFAIVHMVIPLKTSNATC